MTWNFVEKRICSDAVLFHRLLVEGDIFVEERIAHQVLVTQVLILANELGWADQSSINTSIQSCPNSVKLLHSSKLAFVTIVSFVFVLLTVHRC